MAFWDLNCILSALLEEPRTQKSIAEGDKEPNKVFVANLHYKVTPELLETKLRAFADVVGTKIITDSNGTSKKYGFVTLKTQKDVEKLLKLKSKPKIFGQKLVIQPAIKQVIRPYMPQYINLQISKGNFDLAPLDSSNSCVHILDDDCLLHIFQFLPLTKLISLEIVCRRWQVLIYKAISIKFEKKKSVFLDHLINFNIIPTMPVICKMFIILGNEITKLEPLFSSPCGLNSDDEKKVPSIISKLCPNLKEITMNGDYDIAGVNKILDGCKKLESIGFYKNYKYHAIEEANLTCIYERLGSNLQDLKLIRLMNLNGSSLKFLPVCLKKLTIIDCPNLKLDNLEGIPKRCPNLEAFITTLLVSFRFLKDLDKNCPKLTELGIPMECEVDFNEEGVIEEFKILKGIKSLHFFGDICPCSGPIFFEAFSNVEVLEMKGSTWDMSLLEVVDFSVMQNMKYLSLPRVSTRKYSYKMFDDESSDCSIESFKSILKCKQLKSILYMGGGFLDCEWFFKCITECPSLTEVILPRWRFTSSLQEEFISANKNKREIKIVLNHALHESISSIPFKKLKEMNYKLELRVFGTEICFVYQGHDLLSPDPEDFVLSDDDDDLDDVDSDADESDVDVADGILMRELVEQKLFGFGKSKMDNLDEFLNLVGLAEEYGMESLPWEDQKKLMWGGYKGENSDPDDVGQVNGHDYGLSSDSD